MRIFTVGQTQLHRLRSVLNGSRRYYIVLTLASALMFSPLMLPTKAMCGGFVGPNKVYSIRTRSGKALDIDVSWRGQENGQSLLQWDYHGGLNQQFLIEDTHDTSGTTTYYTLQALHSRKVLDVPFASRADSTVLQQHDANGGDNQRFSIELVPGSSFYYIRAKHSGKVLEARGGSTNGTQIVQYQSDQRRSDSQLFSFIQVE